MTTRAHTESAPSPVRFDYSPLEQEVADQIRVAADEIRARLKRTIEGIIEVGGKLIVVKAQLGHGHFGNWLRAEFGWTDRTARNFMAVAENFGDKMEIISDSHLTPTAAYLLAAPSTPEDARRTALQLAGKGKTVTVALARQLIRKIRAKTKDKQTAIPSKTETMLAKLDRHLERIIERLKPEDIGKMSDHLIHFANAMKTSGEDNPRVIHM
jgi:hypothetical protein